MCSGRVGSSFSTSGIRITNHEYNLPWWKHFKFYYTTPDDLLIKDELLKNKWPHDHHARILHLVCILYRAVLFKNAFSVCDINWWSLEDSGKDDRFIVVYKIANENEAITKPLRQSRNMHSSSFIITPCKIQQTQESFSPHMISD